MRFILTLAMVLNCVALLAQTQQGDLDILRKQKKPQATETTKQNFIGKAYHYTVLPQLGHECFFEPACGPFSRGAMQEFNFIKGAFLSVDRVIRCNRFAAIESLPVSQVNGKVLDVPKSYRLRR